MMCCELIRPSATTEKQYALYLRVLSYSIYYTTTILKSYNVTNAAFYERLASNVTSRTCPPRLAVTRRRRSARASRPTC